MHETAEQGFAPNPHTAAYSRVNLSPDANLSSNLASRLQGPFFRNIYLKPFIYVPRCRVFQRSSPERFYGRSYFTIARIQRAVQTEKKADSGASRLHVWEGDSWCSLWTKRQKSFIRSQLLGVSARAPPQSAHEGDNHWRTLNFSPDF